MTLISDVGQRMSILRNLGLPAQVLTCGKQDEQVPHGGVGGPRNPARNRLRRVHAQRTCILIKAA